VTRSDAPLVRFHQLARTFGRGASAVVAVHGAAGCIHPGDRIAAVGVSGSGKSTLLHLLAGLDTPTAGTIEWPALGDRATLRPGPVGIVFQTPSLLPPLDVIENVALPVLMAGIDPASARALAESALDRLGLADLADRLPEELSGGQAQRVAVARVLAGAPRLILADEPTGQLDHETGATVIAALLEAADDDNAALVVTTHDPAVAAHFDIRWVMSEGRLSAPEVARCSV
jgi:putative ABC transport system ATP-binding protein